MENKAAKRRLPRSRFLIALILILMLALMVRIFLIQTVDFDRYSSKVIEQQTKELTLTPLRGDIVDRNGVILATNIIRYRVFISPKDILSAQEKADQEGKDVRYAELISEKLSEILGVEYEDVLEQTTYTNYLDRTIAKGVDDAKADAVRAFIEENSLNRMIYLEEQSVRYYPYGSLASHVIGFTGGDGNGLYGLEYQYNDLLSGKPGKAIVARDVTGNEMPYDYNVTIEAQNGDTIRSTLDVYVQATLEEALAETCEKYQVQNRACGIVVNVNSLEILALAVNPSFDLNNPRELDPASQQKLDESGLDEDSEEYLDLLLNLQFSMWSNKAITESYIPGSTFKVITSSMGLEEQAVTLSDEVNCTGSLTIKGSTIHCHVTTGHGYLTFAEGLQQSCNVWFMTLGRELGISTFTKYYKAFGYNTKTGIDLPGEGDSLISSNMTELDLAIYAFGQNFTVTPIQQITAISAVANGGYLLTPHLLQSVVDAKGNVVSTTSVDVRRQVISEETSRLISQILYEGVATDGGSKNAYVPGYRIAAKTGTSEKKGEGNEGYYICSCVSFAPADSPEYAVIIMVDEPTVGTLAGSTCAAPYAAKVMKKILPYLGVDAVYTEEELENLEVSVPSVIGWGAELAQTYAPYWGVTIYTTGVGEYIQRQYPSPEEKVEKDTAVIYAYTDRRTTEVTETIVPDLSGMTAEMAKRTLYEQKLNTLFTGSKAYISSTDAFVVSQSIPAGTTVPAGTAVQVEILYLENSD